MRYLLIIFGLFFSANLFADTSPPSCSGVVTAGCTNASYLSESLGECSRYCSGSHCAVPVVGMPLGSDYAAPSCGSTFNIVYSCANNCSCSDGKVLVNGSCSCPVGTSWVSYPAGGGTCVPDSCPAGQITNTVSGPNGNITSCIDKPDGEVPPGEDCPEDSKVYDPISGTLVCPGSGDGSSSASSQNCVVPGDYNGDCIPDDESSSASSGAASSAGPSSASGSSSGNDSSSGSGSSSGNSGGDGDGSGTGPGTGSGTGPGTGSETSTGSGGSSTGSNTSSGSESSWTPNSGYGNWIPVNPGSNCPNQYQDKEGQWWCWGGPSNGSSAGSATSGSAGSGSSGSASSSGYSGGDDCESEPVCPEGEANCLILVQTWHTRCGGEPLDDKIFELPEEGAGEELSFSNSLAKFKKELEKLPNTQAITSFFQFNASGSCPVWSVSVMGFEIVIDQQCSSHIPWGIISGILIAVASLVAARVALT